MRKLLRATAALLALLVTSMAANAALNIRFTVLVVARPSILRCEK
jgi:hypothetical protein